MPTLIHRRVAAAQKGENPHVITKLPSGWAVMGDVQFLRGYCLLLPDPVVGHLNELKGRQRQQFLDDMTRLGDAVLAATKAVRINYEMLGNAEPALHAHVFPRYDDESPELMKKPVWFYDWERAPAFDPKADKPLVEAILRELAR